MSRSNTRAAIDQRRDHAPGPVALSDRALVSACEQGDEGAWRELVERYGRLVFSIPRRYGFDECVCEDVFQEVFSILVRQLPRIHNGNGLPKWFMTTTHRVCRQVLRKAPRAASLSDQVLDAESPPLEQTLEWEQQHLVRMALRRLGPRCQELLLAQFLPARAPSYMQVAEQLDMPVGSVGPTRARCLKKLIEILEEFEAGGGGEGG
jgi:RNA polymerase sigma factor (sigma-70 family)